MRKILYIEDELDWSFITNSFGDILSNEEQTALRDSENDEETIFKAIQNNQRLEIVSDFAEALRRIYQRLEEYDILLVDRNLFGDGRRYNKRDIISIHLPLAYKDVFDTREGDFLLHLARYKRYDIDNKFYIITGNTDEIRYHPEFEHSLSEAFKNNNIIVKGSGDVEKICSIVATMDDRLNRVYLEILKNYICNETANKFLKVLKNKDDESSISDNLKEMRTIYESILKEFIERIPGMKANCIERNGKLRNNWIIWLENERHINSIQRYFFQSIYKIGSEFGAHYNENKAQIYKPTTETVNALVYSLKDIILWFDKTCKLHTP